MKKIASVLILIGCFFALNAQEKSPAKVDTSQMAKIVFDKTVCDYGNIAQGSKPSCSFTFTNRGKSPLVLSGIKAACGCTTTSWTKDTIFPGRSGKITVKFDTNHDKFLGPFMRAVTVISNALNSSVELQLIGVIKKL